MKKLLMGTIVLCGFALSISLVQISCSKSDAQNRPADVPQQNKIIYLRDLAAGERQIWISNYDGSGAAPIPLSLPATVEFDRNVQTASLSVSPDGQTIFFTAVEDNGTTRRLNIYSCDMSGNNLTAVVIGAQPGSTDFYHHPVAF